MTKINNIDFVSLLSKNLFIYDLNDIYSGDFLINHIYSSEEYNKVFNKYIKKDNFLKIIISKKYKKGLKLEYIIDKFYNVKYALINEKYKSGYFDLKPYINTDNIYLDIKPKIIKDLDKYNIPQLIDNKQWYGGYSKHNEPWINIVLILNNKKYFNNIKNNLLTKISIIILNFIFDTLLYKSLYFFDINVDYDINYNNINIYIKTINDIDKTKIFINEILNILLNIKKYNISHKFIKNTIKSVYNNIKNKNLLNPNEYFLFIINSKYKITDLLKQIKLIQNYEILNFIYDIFIDTSLITFVYGNININDCKLFHKINYLYKNHQYNDIKQNLLNNMIIKHPNKLEKLNTINYLYYIGTFNPRTIAIVDILKTILSDIYFDTLRTKEQLGYDLRYTSFNLNDQYYILEQVQSDKSVKYVKNKIDTFNKKIYKYINDANLDNIKKNIKLSYDTDDKNLDDNYNKYLYEILYHKYLFNRKELIKIQFDTILKDDLILFLNNLTKKEIIISGN